MKPVILLIWYSGQLSQGLPDSAIGLQYDSFPDCYRSIASYAQKWNDWRRRQHFTAGTYAFGPHEPGSDHNPTIIDAWPVTMMCEKTSELSAEALQIVESTP